MGGSKRSRGFRLRFGKSSINSKYYTVSDRLRVPGVISHRKEDLRGGCESEVPKEEADEIEVGSPRKETLTLTRMERYTCLVRVESFTSARRTSLFDPDLGLG